MINLSSNHILYIEPAGQKEKPVNCVHYFKCRRSEVPESELEKVRQLEFND